MSPGLMLAKIEPWELYVNLDLTTKASIYFKCEIKYDKEYIFLLKFICTQRFCESQRSKSKSARYLRKNSPGC